MADAEAGGADNGQVVLLQEAVHRADRTVGTVFNGQYAELAEAGFHSGHYGRETLHIYNIAPGQNPVAGHLGVGPLHPLAGHKARLGEDVASGGQGGLDLLLHLGRLGDQFRLPGTGQFKEGGIQVIGVPLPIPGPLCHLGQDLPLPLLVEDGQMVFVLIGGHLLGEGHTL